MWHTDFTNVHRHIADRRLWAGLSANRNVWSAALSQAKNEVTGWSAQMYSAFVGAQAPVHDGMRCARLHFPSTRCWQAGLCRLATSPTRRRISLLRKESSLRRIRLRKGDHALRRPPPLAICRVGLIRLLPNRPPPATRPNKPTERPLRP